MTNSASLHRLPLSLIIIFFIVTALLVLAKDRLLHWGIDPMVVIAGNIILFAVSITSFFFYQRAMRHPTTMGFLRNTYSGLFFKLLVCIIAIAVYVMLVRQQVNKPGIFACVFLYFLYTLLEMRSLMQWNKARRNA
jgi:hypothetical protein